MMWANPSDLHLVVVMVVVVVVVVFVFVVVFVVLVLRVKAPAEQISNCTRYSLATCIGTEQYWLNFALDDLSKIA